MACIVGFVPLAAAIGFSLWFAAYDVSMRPLLAVLVVIFVVLHRTACVGFSDVQFKARVAATFAGAMAVMFIVVLAEDLQLPAPFLQLGGFMLLAVGLMGLGMAFYNQVKQRR
jgi:hypothetical protein